MLRTSAEANVPGLPDNLSYGPPYLPLAEGTHATMLTGSRRPASTRNLVNLDTTKSDCRRTGTRTLGTLRRWLTDHRAVLKALSKRHRDLCRARTPGSLPAREAGQPRCN